MKQVPPVALEPHHGLAPGAGGDALGRHRRRADLAQGAAARLRGAAIQADVPLSLVQRWLGHADLATTAIYVDAVGGEERALAARMWGFN